LKRLLSIDTSTWWGGVALVEQGPSGDAPTVVAEIGVRVGGSHAEHLLTSISRLLADAGWSKNDPEAFVATRGPGSFTGIRVGLGTLRGLGLATGRPCFGVTTFEALAEASGPARCERMALIGAGRGELYGMRFDPDGSPPVEREPPWVAGEREVLERVAGQDVRLIPAPGVRLELPSASRAHLARAPRGLAAAAGTIVAQRHPIVRSPAPPLAPVYVRPPDVRLERRR
jgi:tRNA threonylcarbamoyladenosine biosynthesis protein TsaB